MKQQFITQQVALFEEKFRHPGVVGFYGDLQAFLTTSLTLAYDTALAHKGENERKAFQRGYDEAISQAIGCVSEENGIWRNGNNNCRTLLENLQELKSNKE